MQQGDMHRYTKRDRVSSLHHIYKFVYQQRPSATTFTTIIQNNGTSVKSPNSKSGLVYNIHKCATTLQLSCTNANNYETSKLKVFSYFLNRNSGYRKRSSYI